MAKRKRYLLTICEETLTTEDLEAGDTDSRDSWTEECDLYGLINTIPQGCEPSIQPWNRGSLGYRPWVTRYGTQDDNPYGDETVNTSYHISLTSGREITSRELARIWRLAGVQGEQRG